jgi:hypothetical protein
MDDTIERILAKAVRHDDRSGRSNICKPGLVFRKVMNSTRWEQERKTAELR